MDKNVKLQAIHVASKRQDRLLFQSLSLDLSAGDLVIVTGLNGVGKSSLLRLFAGLLKPYSGDIQWEGKSIYKNLTNYYKNFHYVSHQNGCRLNLTVWENLTLFSHLTSACLEGLFPILQQFNLEREQHKLVRTLSAGQKRRLALARLWITPKPLWILDEPCTALDELTQHLFFNHLIDHIKQGHMALISTHQPLPITTIPIKEIRLAAC